MSTIYDWITVITFAVLAIIFLQRSAGEPIEGDHMWKYLPPALGCMGANWLGNNDYAIPAVALLVGVMAYIWYVIRPVRKA